MAYLVYFEKIEETIEKILGVVVYLYYRNRIDGTFRQFDFGTKGFEFIIHYTNECFAEEIQRHFHEDSHL